MVDRSKVQQHRVPDGACATRSASQASPDSQLDFEALYESHADYAARRLDGTLEQQQVAIEVQYFKIPWLLALLPDDGIVRSVLEIGCATGELVGALPADRFGGRHGIDISPSNIFVAKRRFPEVNFSVGDFRKQTLPHFDCVVMSDVLEHVEDEVGFLRDAAGLADEVLVNLPLECNWLNRRRNYGPTDVSGHLRKYSLSQGLKLFSDAGLTVQKWDQVWIHETVADVERRKLREQQLGAAYAGSKYVRWLKSAVTAGARIVRPFGRRLFASNLFVRATTAATT